MRLGGPMGIKVRTETSTQRLVIASDQGERGNLTVLSLRDCFVAPLLAMTRVRRDFRGNDNAVSFLRRSMKRGDLMLDIRYRIDRMKAMYALRESGLTETQAQRLDELFQAQDEDGMIALLESATLQPVARKKFEILKQAKLVGDKLTEFSRTIPLPHDKIQALYPEIRDLRTAYDRLCSDADRFMTRV